MRGVYQQTGWWGGGEGLQAVQQAVVVNSMREKLHRWVHCALHTEQPSIVYCTRLKSLFPPLHGRAVLLTATAGRNPACVSLLNLRLPFQELSITFPAPSHQPGLRQLPLPDLPPAASPRSGPPLTAAGAAAVPLLLAHQQAPPPATAPAGAGARAMEAVLPSDAPPPATLSLSPPSSPPSTSLPSSLPSAYTHPMRLLELTWRDHGWQALREVEARAAAGV